MSTKPTTKQEKPDSKAPESTTATSRTTITTAKETPEGDNDKNKGKKVEQPQQPAQAQEEDLDEADLAAYFTKFFAEHSKNGEFEAKQLEVLTKGLQEKFKFSEIEAQLILTQVFGIYKDDDGEGDYDGFDDEGEGEDAGDFAFGEEPAVADAKQE